MLTMHAGAAALALMSCVPFWSRVAPGQPGAVATQQRWTETGQPQEDRQMRFRGMDVNNDGVITRDEWRGNARAFDRQDVNRDGVLSGDEVWTSAPTRTGSSALGESFDNTDRNDDGIISRAEWNSDAGTFARVDANDDGVITRPEFLGEGWAGAVATSGRQYDDDDDADAERRATRAYQAGFDRGLNDGRQAGREDKRLRDRWDLEGQRELEQADAGYQSSVGGRDDYQAGYRAGFRIGYRQGFGRRQP
jgi:hypothetical protein